MYQLIINQWRTGVGDSASTRYGDRRDDTAKRYRSVAV